MAKRSARSASRPRPTARRSAARTFDALPDTLDFRDRIYTPTLVEVPSTISLESYRAAEVPILDQGQEGACTGFGLASVANFLLRVRKQVPDTRTVSPRMLYEMAKRYDEWPGEDYSGSSARGAMKGWHKHGVCGEADWPYTTSPKDDPTYRQLTHERVIRITPSSPRTGSTHVMQTPMPQAIDSSTAHCAGRPWSVATLVTAASIPIGPQA